MKRFMNILLPVLSFAAMSLSAISCIHYWPDEDPQDPTLVRTTVRIHPASAMTLYDNGNGLVETGRYYSSPESEARYFIRIYADENWCHDLVYEEDLVASADRLGDIIERDLELHAMHYRVVVWQDQPRMYDFSGMTSVCVADKSLYAGSRDDKKAQAVSGDMDLSGFSDKWNASFTYDVELVHPVAKMVLVATDVEKFAGAFAANHPGQSGKGIKEVLEECRVRVYYTGYLPTGYNVMGDKLNDARPEYSFETVIRQMDDGEAVIGFDYILVAASTSVSVKIELSDAEGNVINTADGIQVPLERNRITVVKGEFLTKDYGGGIGIDPGFEGNIDINV